MKKNLNTIKNVLLLFAVILVLYLVKVLATLLIPLALALFVALLLQPLIAWFQSKNWPLGWTIVAISLMTTSALGLLGLMFANTGGKFIAEKDNLLQMINDKLDIVFVYVEQWTGEKLSLLDIETYVSTHLSSDLLITSSEKFADSLGGFFGMFFMASLYLMALLGSIMKYEQFLSYLGNDQKKSSSLISAFETVKNSIVGYIKVKFFVSFLTGLGFFIVCLIFGIDFPLFWGFLAFILNFIPTVGSVIATLPPVLMGLIQLEHMWEIVLLLVLLGGVQVVFGSVLEPKLLGDRLSLSTVVVIFGLVFWGYLWGVVGMILSVPLLVLTKVILSQFPDADMLVRLIGVDNTTTIKKTKI
ncbi:MAG: AI-2E family transporter [Flavobacteriales bacterium]|nr:AI-2E family transporter [Flavobacteriales bacterium]